MVPGWTSQGRREVWRQVTAGVCLLAPGGALLWVPLYASGTPRVLGVPFFYWYQLAWVLLTPVFMTIAYVLLRRRPGGRDSS
jgi:membrane protein implicated in regulation of membrane protease activity